MSAGLFISNSCFELGATEGYDEVSLLNTLIFAVPGACNDSPLKRCSIYPTFGDVLDIDDRSGLRIRTFRCLNRHTTHDTRDKVVQLSFSLHTYTPNYTHIF